MGAAVASIRSQDRDASLFEGLAQGPENLIVNWSFEDGFYPYPMGGGVANCWVAFVGLIRRGLEEVIYPKPLAQYAIRQVRSGRKVGIKANVNDITSRHCQVRKGVRVKRLDHYNVEEDEWKEVLIEDRHAGPAETAIAKIDIGNWFGQLKPRDRAIASYLALGNGTSEAAKAFRVSKGRIAQKRREFLERWRRFQNEPVATAVVA